MKEVFAEACDLPADRRHAFLDSRCADSPQLRLEIESLLAAYDQADRFLPDPTITRDRLSAIAPFDTAQPADAADSATAPGARIGRYRLLRLIGEGGFGAVYLAEQEQPVRRHVALKLIKLGMDTRQVIARFEAERQALAMMEHPNIAHVFDAGATDTGRPYFVMELIDGVPITDYCDAHRLSARQRLELFVPVCQAVQHAHQKGIIHRDLKPTNVLVTLQDGTTPVPKVIDFGVAKATQAPLTEHTMFTESRQMIGTPAYMSPEQAEVSGAGSGLDVDTRSDVYSLGVLLYELLTGSTPFDARELRSKAYAEIQRVIREVEPPRPSTRLATMSAGRLTAVASQRQAEPRKLGALMRGELDWVVMKCLEKDRARRYETAAALAADVRRYLDDEPVAARPAGAAYRARKFVTRYKLPVAAAGALAAALVLGTVGTTAGMLRARAAQTNAEVAEGVAIDQRNAALAAQRQAEQSANRAAAVGEFMRQIFALAQPESGPGGSQATAGELLVQAAGQVDKKLAGQPQEQVLVRATLADALQRMGMHDAAVDQWTLAHRTSKALPGGETSEQTLDLAAALASAMYVAGRGEEAVDLVTSAHASARRHLGDANPVTWKAANASALCLSAAGRGGEAHAVWDDLARRLRPVRSAHTIEHLGRYLANLAASHQDRGEFDQWRAVMREATAIVHADAGRLNADENASSTAASSSASDDAPAAPPLEPRVRLGRAYPETIQSSAWLVRMMVEAGDAQRAAQTLETVINVGLVLNKGIPTLTDRMADLAHLKLRNGDRRSADRWFSQSVQAGQRLRPTKPMQDQTRWREWVLGCSSLADGWKSAALRDQVWCALDDLLRDNAPTRLERHEADVERARFTLRRWRGGSSGVPEFAAAPEFAGGLPEFKALAEPEPGLYLLGMEVPRTGGAPMRRACWLTVTPWRLTFHAIPRFESVRSGASPRWEQKPIALTSEPFDVRSPSGLALNDVLSFAGGGSQRLHWFGAIARTRLHLPAGRYRISASADDGVRVWLDDRLVVDRWIPQGSHTEDREATVVGGPGGHELKVEFFQAVGGYQLWVQVAPVTGPALDAFAALGGGVPEPECLAKIFYNATLEKPDDPGEAYGHAHALARAGRFSESAAAFEAAMRIDPGRHTLPYYLAGLLAYSGDARAHSAHCLRMLDRFAASTDPTVCEQVARACAVAPGPQATAPDLAVLRQRIATGGAAPREARWCRLAEGMIDYRAGRYLAAFETLEECAPAFDAEWPTARATADLLLSMAAHQLGRHDDAVAAFNRADAWLKSDCPRPGATDLMKGGLDNWLFVQTARREAEELLKAPQTEK